MKKRRMISAILALVLTISMFSACGNTESNGNPEITEDKNEIVVTTPYSTNESSSEQSESESNVTNVITPQETTDPVQQITIEPTDPVIEPTKAEKEKKGMTEQELNSFSMLYYLAITAEDIRISKDNRLILNDIYTSLLNDINPGAIDETTQDHLKNLRDIIKSYINISVKRDRLQYIYNQDKAASIRSAVPNPLAILSVTNSLNWKQLATSVVYTVVDSYTNYKNSNHAADQEFLMSGWELDDEETAAIQKNRERAFDYMVDIVQEYDLDGKLTLNEQSIETFAEICNIDSVQQKIRRLESEEETYALLGNYWLELADCYYQTAKYEKCLECVDKYNALAAGIYRKDHNYVQILPKAIVAAQETYIGDEYIYRIQEFTDAIMKNTNTEEWSTRYFAAQSYLDLYARTNNKEYLEAAYNIAYDNVTIVLDEQRELNTTYLEKVKEETVSEPDYRFMTEKEKEIAEKEFKAEQKRVKEYNNALKEARKTELPPMYEPLVLNCELLFALADEMDISKEEMLEIEDILRTDENGVFLSKPVNVHYSFTTTNNDYNIELEKDKVKIPVNLLTTGAEIIVTASNEGKTTTFDDCVVSEVVRKGDTIDTFKATISSDMMKEYGWNENSKVTVKIINGNNSDPLVFNFKVIEFKDYKVFADKVVFAEE